MQPSLSTPRRDLSTMKDDLWPFTESETIALGWWLVFWLGYLLGNLSTAVAKGGM